MTSALDLLMDSDSTAETTTLLESNGICTIDSRTRTIFVPPEIIVGAVQSDKNAERIKFSCPKIVGDNLDLSKFSIRINFENVSIVDPDISIKDQYICEDASINGDNITFSWVIGKNAARYMGIIRFIVCAVKTDSDSNISIEWNTTVAQIPVLEGIEVDQPSLDENDKDVINQLLAITKTASDEAVKNVNHAKEQAIADIQNVSQPDKTLTVEGGIADAKVVGDKFKEAKAETDSLKEDIGDIWVDKTVNIESDGKTYFFKFDVKSGETFIIQNNTDGWANISTKEQPLTSAPDVQLLANMKPNSAIEVVISDSAPYIRFYSSKVGVIYLKKKNTIVERIQTDINKLKEQKMFICAKDGSGDFTKIVDAVNYINDNSVVDATLYICDGTWDICSEYGAEMETMNSKKRGLYLKNRIHIICSSRAVITAKYTGTNDTVREWFSAFNAGKNGFILENAKIETDNIRYCVHDERDADSDCYKNQYINCDMTHTNGFYVQCIGGGLGLDGHIIIDGCKFKGKVFGSQDTPLVSYHNSADGAWDNTESKGAKSFIDIKGCYLADKGTFNFINLGKSDKLTTVLLHDNSIGGAIQISNGSKFYQQNIEILEWNNVNRNTN